MTDTAPASLDTQWARYEVFQQTRADASFSNVGSVHAPDAEIALQNARDVFVRRPQTVRLWVAPADQIFSRTAQELAAETSIAGGEPPAASDNRYYVFRKTSQRRAMTFVTLSGEVSAASPQEALSLARERFDSDRETTFVWWIVPVEAVVATRDEDIPSMFEPAQSKTYRMPTEYRTQTMMRELEERQRDS